MMHERFGGRRFLAADGQIDSLLPATRPLPGSLREQERAASMPDERFYRQQARKAMRSASDTIDPELAEHYRALAAAYLALARFFERSARYHRVQEEARATARPAAY